MEGADGRSGDTFADFSAAATIMFRASVCAFWSISFALFSVSRIESSISMAVLSLPSRVFQNVFICCERYAFLIYVYIIHHSTINYLVYHYLTKKQ